MSSIDKISFESIECTADYPMARALLEIKGVVRVSFCKDFVEVVRHESADWDEVCADVSLAIDEFLQPRATDQDDSTSQTLKEIIKNKVAPAIAGGVIYLGREGGQVYLSFTDSCAGCKYSSRNLSAMICRLLKYYVPEVDDVLVL
jgi:Fe-S cluster biogenesis protein NfuA